MGILYLIKPGELTLKGKNRKYFEDRLIGNVKAKLKGVPHKIQNRSGRVYLETEERFRQAVDRCLRTTPGIAGFAEALCCEKELSSLVGGALELARRVIGKGLGFKVEAKREDKGFPLTSYQIACEVGRELQQRYPDLQVRLQDPDWVLRVEVRDKIYLYVDGVEGLRGLPTGTSGKGLLLLSGGIDSPVAGFLMGVRGMALEAVYYHSPPYTGDKALQKVQTLAAMLAQYTGTLTLHVVPFTQVQVAIRERGVRDEATLMNRAAMMWIASRLATYRKALCLITGESLGQVASQTLQSIRFTDSVAETTVLRPLVGMDKEWIMEKARQIGTYDVSILPYEDCCSLFSPPHPVTRPRLEPLREHWRELCLEDLLIEALRGTTRYAYSYSQEPLENDP